MKNNIIPFYTLSLSVTYFYIGILILIPLGYLFGFFSTIELSSIYNTISDKRVWTSFYITFKLSFFTAMICTITGFIIAWTITRYDFKFKKIIDFFIDIPFALPTAIAGIALNTIYSGDGVIGYPLSLLGIKIVYTELGIIIAMIFVSIPFVIRIFEVVIKELDTNMEQAALCLGASKLQSFRKIVWPNPFPYFIISFGMAFARSLSEFGSIIFIAGNIPNASEVVSLLIYIKIEQYDIEGAVTIASIMLFISFLLIGIINFLKTKFYLKIR